LKAAISPSLANTTAACWSLESSTVSPLTRNLASGTLRLSAKVSMSFGFSSGVRV
jgi:hypothetical protein